MPRKLPLEAFDYYVALGPGRSYRVVAEHFGVAKKTVVERAKREDWQNCLRRIENEVEEPKDDRAADRLVRIYEREMESLELLLAIAFRVLQSRPGRTGRSGKRR